MELQFGFNEPKGARENGIVVNKTEKGFCVITTGERGFVSRENLFNTSSEAYNYVLKRLRFIKEVLEEKKNHDYSDEER